MSVNPEEPKESPVLKWTGYFLLVWPKIRDYSIKFILLRFLPRFVSSPWGWIITTVGTWAVDHVVKPIYDYTVRKIIVYISKKKNNQAGKDVQESKTEDDFNSTYDDLP